MATHRIIITKVETAASVDALTNPAPETKVFEQCVENLDVSAFAVAINTPKRTRVRGPRGKRGTPATT